VWLERFAASRAARVVCVSQSVADDAMRRGRLPPEKIVVIPNGIDVTRYDAARPLDATLLGQPQGRRLLAFVGRLDQQKGVDWLLDLSPQLLEQCPHHDLVIVGDGPLRSEYERAVDRKGLGARVRFLGWRSDIPEVLGASEVLLLPSRWEGMPNVVLEAMASRLPVVATHSEGVLELLGGESPSQTVPFGDTQAFIAKAVTLANDRDAAARIGLENRLRVENTFSLTAMIAAYSRLFQGLAAARSQ
jgi:glycosyltransferase involved in cell wall biosynthesis